MARELKASIRKEKGTHAARRMRRDGQVPAVIYREGQPGTNLTLALNEWTKVLSSGERVVTLKMEGGDKQALIKDVQYDAVRDSTLHVDFSELREGQKVRVAIALVLKGVPKGHIDGGILNQPVHTLHVECLPTKIPDKITIDVEPMGIDDAIHIKEIKFPDGVTSVDDPNMVVAAVHEPRMEAAPEVAGPTEPEVLTAKKEEAPAAEGAAAGGPPPKAGEKKDEKKDEKKK